MAQEENPNIIIVGGEQSGKTRLLERLALDILPSKRKGFLTREDIKNIDGQVERVSYFLQEIGLSDVNDQSFKLYMGDVTFETEGNTIISPQLEDATKRFKEMGRKLNGSVLLADEITLMDGLINDLNFYALVNSYLNSPNLVIATCSSLPERIENFQPQHYFVNAVLKRPDVKGFRFDLCKENAEQTYLEIKNLIPEKYRSSGN